MSKVRRVQKYHDGPLPIQFGLYGISLPIYKQNQSSCLWTVSIFDFQPFMHCQLLNTTPPAVQELVFSGKTGYRNTLYFFLIYGPACIHYPDVRLATQDQAFF